MEQERLAYLNEISRKVIGAAIAVHKELGPGLLESIYELCLVQELQNQGVNVLHQVEVPLYYKGVLTDKKFRIDVLVENEVIVELKAVETVLPIHEAQLLTYMKLSAKNLGLLINFNVSELRKGVRRRILG